MRNRDTFTGTVAVIANCEGCDWRSEAKNAVGNAAQHHDRTGHVVTVEILRHVRYGKRADDE